MIKTTILILFFKKEKKSYFKHTEQNFPVYSNKMDIPGFLVNFSTIRNSESLLEINI